MKRLSLLVVSALLMTALPALAVVYTWTGSGGNTLWTNAANWAPVRSAPATTDTLSIAPGDSQAVTGVPTETVSVLQISGNSIINMQAGAAAVLTVNNAFLVTSGSRQIISGANALTTQIATGGVAAIGGTIEYIGGTHKINAADASGIVFFGGSTMIQGLLCTGNIFTNAGTANAVVFQAGSQFIQYTGSNPFGLTAPASKVIFQPGSWFRSRMSGTPSFSNRTYANFQLDFPTASFNATGGGISTLDTLLITDGRMNFQTRHINIKGAIIVLDTLYFNSATSCSLYLNGTSQQTMDWSAANSFMMGAATHVLVDNAAGIALNSNLVVNCKLHLLTGVVVTGANTVSVTTDSAIVRGTGYVQGTLFRPIGLGAGVVKDFPVGNSSGYTPATLTFANVTTGGGAFVGVSRTTHPGASVPANTMQNVWMVSPSGGLVFDTCSAVLGYLSADFNTGFSEATDEETMVAGKYVTGAWTFPTIGVRDTSNNTIQLTGLAGFSDFTLGKNEAAFAVVDTDSPAVTYTYPADGAAHVLLTDFVKIGFSENINNTTFAYHINPPVTGGVSPTWTHQDTVIIVPNIGTLDLGTTFTVTVDSARDIAGNPMASPDSFSFTTVFDTTYPHVTGTVPANNAEKVGLDQPIILAFSEPMDPATLSFGYSASVTYNDTVWNAAGDSVWLYHTTMPLWYDEFIQVRMANKDTSGNGMLSDYNFVFSTVVDTTKPQVIATAPANGDSNVALGAPVWIAFSKPMDTLSLVGTINPPLGGMSTSWSATCDTVYVAHNPFAYNTTYTWLSTAGTDTFGNDLAVLPDSFMFTTIANQGPAITMVLQPGDTYDGTGPFAVKAVVTDPAKAGISFVNLSYSNGGVWSTVSGVPGIADTFSFEIPGGLAAGSLMSYFLYSEDDAGAQAWSPATAPIGVYSFKVLNPLPPTALTANGLEMAVDLSWAPPVQTLSYNGAVTYMYGSLPAGFIQSTRFTPMHYPCKLEQATSIWYNYAGMDSVIVHVYADDGTGAPDEAAELMTPFRIMPQESPTATVVDLSAYNIVLTSGEFHIGYELVTAGQPACMSDAGSTGPIRSLYKWTDGFWYGDLGADWTDQAVVSYSAYTKGLALKSSHLRKGQKPNYAMGNGHNLKPEAIANKQAVQYPKLAGALAMAKNLQNYEVFRGSASGGAYTSLGTATNPTYMDLTALNGTPYYYVVRANYTTPDTFSAYSNEATATPVALPILLVDDDGSDDGGAFYDVRPDYIAALDSAGQAGNYAVYNVTNDGGGADTNWMKGRTHVIWTTGYTFGDGYDSTLTPANEANLAWYLNQGGRLFLSGGDYIYDKYGMTPAFTAGDFPYDYLGVSSAASDIWGYAQHNFTATGEGFSLADGQEFVVDTLDGSARAMYPDNLTKRTEASYVFNITANSKVGEKVAVQYTNGTFRTVFFAFPFENITNGVWPSYRGELMARILSWLTTGVEGKPTADLTKPMVYSLGANYPNPVHMQTTVKFALPKAGRVGIAVYNVMGQKVKTLVDGSLSAGYHSVNWNGRNEGGQAVAAGVYMYKMQAEGFTSTRKLVVVR